MDKKVLIVSLKGKEVIGHSIAKVLELIDVRSDVASQEDALIAILSEKYTHIVITDYSEKEKELSGFASYRDISASANGQKVIRCGEEKLNYSDYVQYSNMLPRLYEMINEV